MIEVKKCIPFLLFIAVLASCGKKKISYEETVKQELAKDVRIDSLLYGIHLGMTYDDFHFYCWNQHLEGLFRPNVKGNAVIVDFSEGFRSTVEFEFFPEVLGKYKPIKKINGIIKYKNFSYYDKKYSLENLLAETIGFFEKGYGGNKFITIPHENKLMKYNYVKIDGNRKILLKPTFDGSKIFVQFEDLKPIDDES